MICVWVDWIENDDFYVFKSNLLLLLSISLKIRNSHFFFCFFFTQLPPFPQVESTTPPPSVSKFFSSFPGNPCVGAKTDHPLLTTEVPSTN